eukprot:TRINITY_DN7404_c0_g1_i1.p1 TRINITY_DN7404_c0_g1~~TRINITY_DN7404_c0_g1_i1.p1  ORF type:complete len:171 (+),score=47.56 TRINITY_DN7404_c0_g1_i1:218-730(+)
MFSCCSASDPAGVVEEKMVSYDNSDKPISTPKAKEEPKPEEPKEEPPKEEAKAPEPEAAAAETAAPAAPAVQAPKAPPSPNYTVVLVKTEPRLGLLVEAESGVVHDIPPSGCIARHNQTAPEEQQVKVNDTMVSVNGHCTNVVAKVQEVFAAMAVGKGETVKLEFRRRTN